MGVTEGAGEGAGRRKGGRESGGQRWGNSAAHLEDGLEGWQAQTIRARGPFCQVAKSATYQSPEARFPGSRAQGCTPQRQPFSSYGESGVRRGTIHFPGEQGGLADLPRVPCHGLGPAENSPSPRSTVTRGWSGSRLVWQTVATRCGVPFSSRVALQPWHCGDSWRWGAGPLQCWGLPA